MLTVPGVNCRISSEKTSAGSAGRTTLTSRTTSSYLRSGIRAVGELDLDQREAVERGAVEALDVLELGERVLDRVDDEPLDVLRDPRPGTGR